MKKLQKNNKGFSLVELIIVIAIMAVLMTVLAPQFLRYVERSRLQSDNTALGEIANACKIAATDETIANAVGATGSELVVTIPLTTERALAASDISGGTGAGAANAQAALLAELQATIGNVALTSNTYTQAASAPAIQMVLNGNVIQVQAINYINEVGATAATNIF